MTKEEISDLQSLIDERIRTELDLVVAKGLVNNSQYKLTKFFSDHCSENK